MHELAPNVLVQPVGAVAPRPIVCEAQEPLSLFFTETLNRALEPHSVEVPVGEAVMVGAAVTQGIAPCFTAT